MFLVIVVIIVMLILLVRVSGRNCNDEDSYSDNLRVFGGGDSRGYGVVVIF